VAELRVSVVYAERDRETLVELAVPAGTTVGEAVVLSDIRARHGGISSDTALGIFGMLVKADQVLADGDRVELYRPLPHDPKITRRRLAREGRTMGRTSG